MVVDVYKNYPNSENRYCMLRITNKEDKIDWLKVYSDEKSVPFFNGDKCDGDDFHYKTENRMEKVIAMLENGETDIEVVQEKLDEVICAINDLQGEFYENDSEIETVARDCIGETVGYILQWFDISIGMEEAIRERDW